MYLTLTYVTHFNAASMQMTTIVDGGLVIIVYLNVICRAQTNQITNVKSWCTE